MAQSTPLTMSYLRFLQEFDWWSSLFKHFDEPVPIGNAPAVSDINTFGKRFIEVFEETKPLIKLR